MGKIYADVYTVHAIRTILLRFNLAWNLATQRITDSTTTKKKQNTSKIKVKRAKRTKIPGHEMKIIETNGARQGNSGIRRGRTIR